MKHSAYFLCNFRKKIPRVLIDLKPICPVLIAKQRHMPLSVQLNQLKLHMQVSK